MGVYHVGGLLNGRRIRQEISLPIGAGGMVLYPEEIEVLIAVSEAILARSVDLGQFVLLLDTQAQNERAKLGLRLEVGEEIRRIFFRTMERTGFNLAAESIDKLLDEDSDDLLLAMPRSIGGFWREPGIYRDGANIVMVLNADGGRFLASFQDDGLMNCDVALLMLLGIANTLPKMFENDTVLQASSLMIYKKALAEMAEGKFDDKFNEYLINLRDWIDAIFKKCDRAALEDWRCWSRKFNKQPRALFRNEL